MKNMLIASQSFFHETNPWAVFLGLCIAVFCSIQVGFYGVVLVVLLNFISGVWKSAVINRRLTIKASGLYKMVMKVGGYGIAIATFGIADVLILQITNQEYRVTLSMVIAGIIILYEGKSVTDNLYAITGNRIFRQINKSVSEAFKRRIDMEIDQKVSQPVVVDPTNKKQNQEPIERNDEYGYTDYNTGG
jgi:hypothetical protein